VLKSLWVLCVCFLVFISPTAFAKTPDGKPPSRETVCDNEEGAAYGLCVAYCEAMDCTDPNQRASNQGCESVKNNFEKHTGRSLPCECPCGMLQLFADIQSGVVRVTRCFIGDFSETVITETGDVIIINNFPAFCSTNNAPPFIPLDANQLTNCKLQLQKLVEAQGVACEFPE
jgi:hypothetical protein